MGKLIFQNKQSEEHYLIKLTRSILYHDDEGNEENMTQILATTRHEGDTMDKLLNGQELICGFSYLRGSALSQSSLHVRKYSSDIFRAKDFIWIGIGDLSIKRPKTGLIDPPWDMITRSEENKHG